MPHHVHRAIAIETSGRVGSVAVVEHDDGRGGALRLATCLEETFPHGLRNAAQMLPIIDRMIRSVGWTPGDVRRVYLSAGPGSFTGLRIATTFAKSLGWACGAKLVAVPTVRVLVENAPAEAEHVVVVLDAKRGQVFTASFDRADTPDRPWVEREPARVDVLDEVLARAPRPVYLIGEGIPYHAAAVQGRPPDQVRVTPEACWRARASVLARLAAELAADGHFVDPFELSPSYVRLPEPEEKWQARHGDAPR